MAEVNLAGCRNQPLGSYLQGLGAWRAVVRLLDPQCNAHWQAGQLVLTGTLTAEAITEGLCDAFGPVPIVSPWNSGSGFADNGKSVTAERAIASVRNSADPRLERLRAAVSAADEVVAEGRWRGWGGTSGELWDPARKADVIALCRNRLPDDALGWIDAAVALGYDQDGDVRPAYNRLLGTGGNFGRQDLSATYLQRALTVLEDPKRSLGWLRAALFAEESTPYLRDAVGQFDPGRAGGVQSSIYEKADDTGFANPWSFLLLIEGSLLFASAVVRRHGALTARAALPFVVGASTAGFSSSATGETVHAEIWTPEWDRPARLSEIEHLLGEGRADWRGNSPRPGTAAPARSGLDFVRAISTLGVTRGVSHFTRHVVATRHGQNPLAIPAGRIAVQPRGPVGLLADLDPWLNRLRAADLPTGIAIGLRAVDEALYRVATSNSGTAAAMREVVVTVGRLHETVARSGAARARVGRPLQIRHTHAAAWWAALEPDAAELRIAGALASGLDQRGGQPNRSAGLRLLLTPVALDDSGRRLRWTNRPPRVAGGSSIAEMLAAAHQRRTIPGTIADRHTHPQTSTVASPAVQGVLSAFEHALTVPLADVTSFATGRLDDDLLGDYLKGLLLLDWTPTAIARVRDTEPEPITPTAQATHTSRDAAGPATPPLLALLVPFYAAAPLNVRIREDVDRPHPLLLRPGTGWVATLRMSSSTVQRAQGAMRGLHPAGTLQVAEDAVRRLRAAGIRQTVSARTAATMPLHPDRLATSLLIPIPRRDRHQALRAVATLPGSTPKSRPVHPTVATVSNDIA